MQLGLQHVADKLPHDGLECQRTPATSLVGCEGLSQEPAEPLDVIRLADQELFERGAAAALGAPMPSTEL